MSRDRFPWHLGNVHLEDGRDSPNYDKLYKVRPLLETLSETFRSSNGTSKHQSIDESMIRFKGRSFYSSLCLSSPTNKVIKSGFDPMITGLIGASDDKTSRSKVTAKHFKKIVLKNALINVCICHNTGHPDDVPFVALVRILTEPGGNV
ncbi:unnamed protein product [Acanthoscelides obtectus]|uniref:PiggyBac transposable element-derived protein domain-containing protein n=1 Tax=Acanthoscelides obtectus TaxID=200917 RepID=A0A9P0LEZ4_ACAOB|nr:unnamed protein product [Acanthoscelides obtectus]CAK1684045.1 hypothetical protein AOBTE_LOCUS34590 [Acanthoscelides obtectus]